MAHQWESDARSEQDLVEQLPSCNLKHCTANLQTVEKREDASEMFKITVSLTDAE